MIRAILLILWATAFYVSASGQSGTIKGRVVDARTSIALPFASVYINNTTIGTRTTTDGDFILTRLPMGENELVISYMGYQTYQTKILLSDTATVTLSVKLIAAQVNLKSVQINSKRDDQWKSQLEKFRKLFFGNSPYTSTCKIFNPWVLNFAEGENQVLTATASAPLEIENTALGYKITYQMKSFSVGPSFYTIDGNVRFQELETVDTVLSKLWSKRRAESYRGSHRQLFRAIIEQKAAKEGFVLFEDQSGMADVVRKTNFLTNLNGALVPFDTVKKVMPGRTRNLSRITLPARTEVHYLRRSTPAIIYRNVPNPVSWIEVAGGFLEVTSNGIVLNPSKMTVSGAMGESRFAEILPYNYIPPIDDTPFQNHAYRPLSALAGLVEKPYVQTDRPYYYHNDPIFFKAYMNYVTPVIRDSLSRVLYVELVDPSDKVWIRKVIPVIEGTAMGSLELPASIVTGDYVLQAYTRWMLNFDKHFIFTKPIRILAGNQLAKVPEGYLPDSTGRVRISADRDEYKTTEKITLSLSTVNFFGFPMASALSVSVTDLPQASPVVNEMTILNNYSIEETYLPDTSVKRASYPIQLGIDFNGRFVTKRKKLLPGVLTVFQEHVEDVFAISTDAKGAFQYHLALVDTSGLLIMSRTLKGRSGKVIVDPPPNLSPSVKQVSPLQLEVSTPEDASRYHVSTLPAVNNLEEVTIKAKRAEKASADVKSLKSDFKIERDWLRDNYQTDLLSAIQSRVPGLRVLYFASDGFVKKILVFSSSVSLWSSQECLVEVDGVVLTNHLDQSVSDQLASMSVSEIESIEVIKYGGSASYGARGANGVIIIKTSKGNFAPPRKRTYDRNKLQVVKLAGFSSNISFESPDYSAAPYAEDILDARSTIYWNPAVSTDGKQPATITFFSAGIPTTYRVVVEGIDASGQAVRGEKIIRVTGR